MPKTNQSPKIEYQMPPRYVLQSSIGGGVVNERPRVFVYIFLENQAPNNNASPRNNYILFRHRPLIALPKCFVMCSLYTRMQDQAIEYRIEKRISLCYPLIVSVSNSSIMHVAL